VKPLVHETDLAWALANSARPYLCTVERNDVYTAIGAGETFTAIRQLFKSVAVKRIPYEQIWSNGAQHGWTRMLGTNSSGISVASSTTNTVGWLCLPAAQTHELVSNPSQFPRPAERSADGLAGSRHSPPTLLAGDLLTQVGNPAPWWSPIWSSLRSPPRRWSTRPG
jgi:hypothetical protein